MPAPLSRRVFETIPAQGFASELEINPMIYGLNPDVFAVKAYWHYRSPGVGVMFLQTLLDRDLMSIFPQWDTRVSLDPLAGT
jgi:hypothetical protein